MPFAAAISTESDSKRACGEVLAAARHSVPNPDLAILFVSPHHLPDIIPDLVSLKATLGVSAMIGCVGEAIVGGTAEIELEPALTLWLGSWNSRANVEAFHLMPSRTPDGWSLLGWPDALLDGVSSTASMLILGDPYTFPADQLFLPRINEDYPGLQVIGGNASGTGPGQTFLLVNERVESSGAVGVLLQGDVRMRSIVSQGCRPIGKPLVVTRGQGAVIEQLGGMSPLDQLRELWPQLSTEDQDLVRRGLHVGIVINEYQEKFERGDFLVRNLYGIDSNSGAMQVMDQVRVGQTVQFHVRDAASADEDLRLLLERDRQRHPVSPAAALLFTCNGRGTRLFTTPHHDAAALHQHCGPIPLAGFFAAGEYGPVGGKNFIHGFTASVALFEE
jgi:small ligand-binding sensory domain FIST